MISAKLCPISSKAKTQISASTSNGLRGAHRRCRKNQKEYKEFKEYEEFKNRSQEPESRSQEDLAAGKSLHLVHYVYFCPLRPLEVFRASQPPVPPEIP